MDEASLPPLAIIAMSARLPGGSTMQQFWSLLKEGRSAIQTLSEQALREAGVPTELIANPAYVKCCVPLEGADLFDAAFFGYSPRQAASIDPQQRLFLECAWEALERAGYGCIPPHLTAGVFGGCGYNGYLMRCLLEDFRSDPENVLQTIMDADKDFLTGRVAYKLGLTGPAVTVQSGCSTSLVAVHLACQSLLSHECDIALAGAASVVLPPHTGYLHVEGGIQSRDGACRAFEADASGTLRGNAVGLVVLRRLADAQADGDPILAIIRSTAVNNDGARKVGFTAPGLDSQIRLLRTGLELAGLQPADIDFVEAHGTGTALGDSIELTALQEVYASGTQRHRACVLGAVKTNIGHPDTAAGVVGLMKTVLSLEHRTLLPNVGFRRPNAMLAAPDSVFRVCAASEPWPSEPSRPRRAAVSSFGIGGTNAHVILEEAPVRADLAQTDTPEWLPISARTQPALEQTCTELARHLETHDLSLPDVAFTLQTGRRPYDHRRFIVGSSIAQIIAALRAPSARAAAPQAVRRSVIFLFPGQGAQRQGMLAGLYRTDSELAQDVDSCAERLLPLHGVDLRELLCCPSAPANLDINDTFFAQPALFIAEYALARFWIRQGLTPAAVLGHSVGEYAAACIAGVLQPEDALALVAYRARASRELPDGVMVALSLPEADVRQLLIPGVHITAVNASQQCVVAGELPVMQTFMTALDSRGLDYQRLSVAKAFHTAAAAPVAQGMRGLARQTRLSTPRIPWISSVTAARMTDAQSRDPEHWGQHVEQPVQFAQALHALNSFGSSALLEVGPGRVLTGLARHELHYTALFVALAHDERTTRADLLSTLGEMWVSGVDVNFTAQPRGARRRVELPVHPLERQNYLRSSGATQAVPAPVSNNRLPAERWFNLPSWQRSVFATAHTYDAAAGAWLLLADEHGLAPSLAARLEQLGQDVILESVENFADTFARLDREGRPVSRIIDCTTLSDDLPDSCAQSPSIYLPALTLSRMARAVAVRKLSRPLSLLVVTNRLFDISGCEQPHAPKAALQVFCRCMAQELPQIRCVIVDLPPPRPGEHLAAAYERYQDRLFAEIETGTDSTLAYRQDLRFVPAYSMIEWPTAAAPLRQIRVGGLYVITGGLGRIGLALARRLAGQYQTSLLLIGRRACAQPERLRELQALGVTLLTAVVDAGDASALADAINEAERQCGPVRGVFHLAADLAHPSRSCQVAQLAPSDLEIQLAPKVGGLLALLDALGSRPLDFGVAFSSTSAILGGVGYGAYAAANAVMDSLISSRTDPRLAAWMSIGWDGWLMPGLTPDPYALETEEGLDVLLRLCCASPAPHIIVSATPFKPRVETWVSRKRTELGTQSLPSSAKTSSSAQVLPRSALETQIAQIWQDLLGIESIGVTQSFLELGGDSLIGVRVISRLRETFRVSLAPASLLGENSTIEALSRDIVRAMAALQGQAPRARGSNENVSTAV